MNHPQPHPLSHIEIASPCSADWNAMQGNDQVRFCQQCQLNVYNLSGITRNAAEKLIKETEGRLCVRFYQRHDGTVITQDCPVGLQAIHRKKLTRRKVTPWSRAAAAISLITVAGAFWVSSAEAKAQQIQQDATKTPAANQAIMGDVAVPMMGAPAIQGLMAKPPEPIKPAKSPKKSCKWPKRPSPSNHQGNQGTKQNPPPTSGTQPHPPILMGKMAAPRDLSPQPTSVPDEKPSQP